MLHNINVGIPVVILCEDESKVDLLTSLLSKYYSLEIAFVCHHSAEAIEYLNKHHPTILFMDTDAEDVLFDIKKPPFIVGLCDSVNTKKVKHLLKVGFLEIFYAPFSEKDLNSIMGKILNIYGTYNTVDQRTMQRIEEENLSYNANQPVTKSTFIMGTRNEESIRIVFDNVLYLKKVGNQVCVYFEDGERKYFRSNLKMFASKFPKSMFQKINRSVVVNMNKVSGVIKDRILISENVSFELSRSFKKQFKKVLQM